MLYWDESMSESAADMDHRLTITGMQDAVGSRTVGGLDIVYTKLAVDLQNMMAGQADPASGGHCWKPCATNSDATRAVSPC